MNYGEWLNESAGGAPNLLQKLCLFLARIIGHIKRNYDSPYHMKTRLKLNELTGGGMSAHHLKTHLVFRMLAGLTAIILAFVIAALSSFDAVTAVFGVIVSVLASRLPDFMADSEVKRRRMQLRLDFPYFVMKLGLLLNTGMNLSKAWARIAADSRGTDTVLYREVSRTAAGIASGRPESKAYEDFAKGCRLDEVSRFISILEQYRKKGSFEVVGLLKHLANECWQRRKNVIAKMAEESSTRMLLPLMLIFIGIMIIVIAPAFISFRSIR